MTEGATSVSPVQQATGRNDRIDGIILRVSNYFGFPVRTGRDMIPATGFRPPRKCYGSRFAINGARNTAERACIVLLLEAGIVKETGVRFVGIEKGLHWSQFPGGPLQRDSVPR